MAQINIRMDDTIKQEADKLFADMGLNMGTAVNIFVRQTLRQRGLPFNISAKDDPFYSAENQAHLLKAIEDFESGKSKPIIKTMAELEAMENE